MMEPIQGTLFRPDHSEHSGHRYTRVWSYLKVDLWTYGPFRITRHIDYADAENTEWIGIEWVIGFRLGKKNRVGFKWEHDH